MLPSALNPALRVHIIQSVSAAVSGRVGASTGGMLGEKLGRGWPNECTLSTRSPTSSEAPMIVIDWQATTHPRCTIRDDAIYSHIKTWLSQFCSSSLQQGYIHAENNDQTCFFHTHYLTKTIHRPNSWQSHPANYQAPFMRTWLTAITDIPRHAHILT